MPVPEPNLREHERTGNEAATVDVHLLLTGPAALLNDLAFQNGTLDFSALCPVPADTADQEAWKTAHWGTAEPARNGHWRRNTPTELEIRFESARRQPVGIFHALQRGGLNVEMAYWSRASEFAGQMITAQAGRCETVHYSRERLQNPGFIDAVLNDVAERVSRDLEPATVRQLN